MIQYNLFILITVFLYAAAAFKLDDIRNHLGTKTPYRFKCNKNDSKIKIPATTTVTSSFRHLKLDVTVTLLLGCKATKIWMVIRHGTRLPSAEDIEGIHSILKPLAQKILLSHKHGNGQLTQQQLASLGSWSFKEESQNEKNLVPEGRDEMIHLAKRMQNRFPNIIKHKYSEQNYMFRFTPTERTQESAKHFAIGLFDKHIAENITMIRTSKGDSVLRFYKYCDQWLKQVKNNPRTYAEQEILRRSSLMNRTLETITQRLGLDKTIGVDEADLIYKACAFETAWWKNYVAPWCFAFDKKTIKVLEYYYDLKHYWIDGYGNNLSHRSACSSVKNMFEQFTIKNTSNATFLFSHSGTILKILAHMNLYRPKDPLKGDSMPTDNVWKMSEIDSFASNLAFVLFECKKGDHILTLHQERVIKLPMCEEELCPLEQLTEFFRDTIHNCDHKEICGPRSKEEL